MLAQTLLAKQDFAQKKAAFAAARRSAPKEKRTQLKAEHKKILTEIRSGQDVYKRQMCGRGGTMP